ncbi:MAG TPA: hypothetical protein VKV16_02185 [Solirubrobacteraceae bacterium]|nr:hypothetical protein [Solirubrobacteraceae bacterium]
MSARGPQRPRGRLAALPRAARTRLRDGARRAATLHPAARTRLRAGVRRAATLPRAARMRLRDGARRAVLALALGACAGLLAGAPALALALGEGGGSPGEAGATPAGTSSCPSPNPPDELTLVAGTPQTTTLGAPFASGLQVALANSDGCAVTGAAGVPVTFTAPAAGAGGRFSTTDSNTATVGADSTGSVAAPTFTANADAGSYTVTASSQYGSVSFSLTNTAAGVPAKLVAISPRRMTASVERRYARPLQVRVLDAGGDPVAGATVAFTLGSAAAGACGASATAGASFAGGGAQASATTDSSGLATSPALTANAAAGSFTATASLASGGSGEPAGKAGDASLAPVGFALVNRAGTPAEIAPGAGASQSTAAGSAFAIRLAVTVTDAADNAVPGARVTFSAPSAGAGGLFAIRSPARRRDRRRERVSYARTVEVHTNACGIALAPPFAANRRPGGYVVVASAAPARPAAFALVNEAP